MSDEKQTYQFSLRSFLVSVVLLSVAFGIIHWNYSEFRQSLLPDGPWPHKVLERFMLAWLVTLSVCVFAATRVRTSLVKWELVLIALTAFVAFLVNAYYWSVAIAGI